MFVSGKQFCSIRKPVNEAAASRSLLLWALRVIGLAAEVCRAMPWSPKTQLKLCIRRFNARIWDGTLPNSKLITCRLLACSRRQPQGGDAGNLNSCCFHFVVSFNRHFPDQGLPSCMASRTYTRNLKRRCGMACGHLLSRLASRILLLGELCGAIPKCMQQRHVCR